jgi:hypothetical protein
MFPVVMWMSNIKKPYTPYQTGVGYSELLESNFSGTILLAPQL